MDCVVEPEYSSAGCAGGLMDDVFDFAHLHEVALESDYPYKAKNGKCQPSLATIDAGVTGRYNVAKGDLEGLLELAEHQPVSVAVDASSWSFYHSGIHKNSGTRLSHGVVVIGYSVGAEGEKYLKIRNSWGQRWGEHGYIRVDTVQNSGATLDAAVPTMNGIKKNSGKEDGSDSDTPAECSDGSSPDEEVNCKCTYGKSCDRSSGAGCKPACLCGEFGFCR